MMKEFIATIRIKGSLIKTVVHADSLIHARLLLQYQFGWDSIVSSPVLAETTAPKTPEQLRIHSLKAIKKRAADALAAERQRQQIAKAQKTLSAVNRITPKLPA